jgi:hypothetical protein
MSSFSDDSFLPARLVFSRAFCSLGSHMCENRENVMGSRSNDSFAVIEFNSAPCASLSHTAIATCIQTISSKERDLGTNRTFIAFGNSLKFYENRRSTFDGASRVDPKDFQACCRFLHCAARSFVFSDYVRDAYAFLRSHPRRLSISLHGFRCTNVHL